MLLVAPPVRLVCGASVRQGLRRAVAGIAFVGEARPARAWPSFPLWRFLHGPGLRAGRWRGSVGPAAGEVVVLALARGVPWLLAEEPLGVSRYFGLEHLHLGLVPRQRSSTLGLLSFLALYHSVNGSLFMCRPRALERGPPLLPGERGPAQRGAAGRSMPERRRGPVHRGVAVTVAARTSSC